MLGDDVISRNIVAAAAAVYIATMHNTDAIDVLAPERGWALWGAHARPRARAHIGHAEKSACPYPYLALAPAVVNWRC